jgi:penicillin amidase
MIAPHALEIRVQYNSRGEERTMKKLVATACLALVAGAAVHTARVPASAGAVDPVAVSGLRAEARVVRDAEGIPHIFADNDADAVFMLGYVHAEDRLFQIDALRRRLSGTLAELLGPAALLSDVQLRTLGLRRAAEETLPALAPETRALLESYAAGVNAYLEGADALPPEYAALELTAAGIPPWTALDSLVVAKGLAFSQSFDAGDVELTTALAAFQAAGAAGGFDGTVLFFEDAYRSAPFDGTISIPGFFPARENPKAARAAVEAARALPRVLRPEALRLAREYAETLEWVPMLRETADRRDAHVGSNWWVVSGAKSATGRALMASDPHLGLEAPSVFYEAHLVVSADPQRGPMNVAGVSFAGTPAIVLGANERVSWSATYNPLDVTDVYQERIKFSITRQRPKATFYDGRKEKLRVITQRFNANQVGDGTPDNLRRADVPPTAGGLTFVVPRRNNGPIVSVDLTGGIDDVTALSIQYTGWRATREIEGFLALARAANLEDFRAAVQLLDMPTINVGYADADGNVAYYTSAEMPLREDLQTLGRPDGLPPFLIRDGTHAFKNEWLPAQSEQPQRALAYEILPFEEMPHVVNPARGYIANANQDPVGTTLDNDQLNEVRPGGGVYYLNVGYEGGFRLGRIGRLLDAALANGGKVSAADMMRFQANNQLLDAEVLTPHIVSALANARSAGAPDALAGLGADPRVAEAVGRLADWRFGMPTGIREGFDPGDDPDNLPEPTEAEVRASVAATVYSVWRAQLIANTVDATLARLGIAAEHRPPDSATMAVLRHLLDTFPERQGRGASGVNFFEAEGAPTPEAARDTIILLSLRQALDRLAGPEFAAAFGGSAALDDYRWGRLHRVVFDHALGGQFDVPGAGGFSHLAPDLPGVAKAGGYGSVDASTHGARAQGVNGFMFSSGPARRFVAEMAPGAPVVFQVIPGGQSGDPTSPLYANQLGRWLTDRYHSLPLTVDEARAARATERVFAPRGR